MLPFGNLPNNFCFASQQPPTGAGFTLSMRPCTILSSAKIHMWGHWCLCTCHFNNMLHVRISSRIWNMEFYVWELVTSKRLHSYRSCEHIQLCPRYLNNKTCRDVSNSNGPPFSMSTLPSGIQIRGTGWEPKNRWRRSQVWWIDELLFIWLQHFTVNTTEFQVFGRWMRFRICANCCTFPLIVFGLVHVLVIWWAFFKWYAWTLQMTRHIPRWSPFDISYTVGSNFVGFETLMDPISLFFFQLDRDNVVCSSIIEDWDASNLFDDSRK